MSKTLAVAGSVAQRPDRGGHAWVFLQYLLGFQRLGFDVLFLDWLAPDMCDGPVERSENVNYLAGVMERFGFSEAFCLLGKPSGEAIAGLPRAEAVRRTAQSAFLLNVMGYLDDEELLAAAPRRVFLDIDPGFGQMWCELGLTDIFRGHDVFVTIAENIGKPSCLIPTCGLDWIPTRQPVVLDFWPSQDNVGERFTSIGSWRGPFAPVEYKGETFGLRVHEFRRFFELPRLSKASFELALEIHDAEARDLAQLRANGWRLVDPRRVARSPDAYQAYIAGARAEFMVARNMYVKAGAGWFSDRTICYLATGRPALVQDTGLCDLYPIGKGIVAFRTLEEAVAGAETIEDDYEGHRHAARAMAEEYFDSDKVLGRLVEVLAK